MIILRPQKKDNECHLQPIPETLTTGRDTGHAWHSRFKAATIITAIVFCNQEEKGFFLEAKAISTSFFLVYYTAIFLF